MKTKFYQIVLLCLAFVGMASVVNAQTKEGGYNPFISGNMTAFETKVVTEGSVHTYTYTGDAALTGSKFVFKVVGGTIVTSVGDDTAITMVETNGAGTHTVDKVTNTASIVVKWAAEDGTPKFIAAYELTADGCITNNQIGGLKISVGAKPVITLASADLDACSQDLIPIDITITNGESPWEATINDGTDDITFYFSTDDVTAITGYDHKAKVTLTGTSFTYNWSATGYLNTKTDGTDETYVFTATKVDDKITKAELNDTGLIGVDKSVTATVHPLPTVGTMAQN